MTGVAEALNALDARSGRVAAEDWPGSLAALESPGLYAWWVDPPGAEDLSRGLGVTLPAGLIYIGQAGASSSRAGIPSASSLRSRIGKNHLHGKVRNSTLRRTLAAILLGPLGLTLVGPRQLDGESEERLSAWIQRHLAIAVHPTESGEHLAELEHEVVVVLRPPLNLEHLADGDLSGRLRELRAVVLRGIDDLWVAPDPSLREWREILAEYGQAFDGYRYAQLVRRRECPEIAEEVWDRFRSNGEFTSSFADLRCALFWLQRQVHSAEQSPGWAASAELEADVQRLYGAIQDAWAQIRGVGQG